MRALSYYKYSIIVSLQVPLQASGRVNTVITESLNASYNCSMQRIGNLLKLAWLLEVFVYHKLLIYWDFHTKPSLGFTHNGLKEKCQR